MKDANKHMASILSRLEDACFIKADQWPSNDILSYKMSAIFWLHILKEKGLLDTNGRKNAVYKCGKMLQNL